MASPWSGTSSLRRSRPGCATNATYSSHPRRQAKIDAVGPGTALLWGGCGERECSCLGVSCSPWRRAQAPGPPRLIWSATRSKTSSQRYASTTLHCSAARHSQPSFCRQRWPPISVSVLVSQAPRPHGMPRTRSARARSDAAVSSTTTRVYRVWPSWACGFRTLRIRSRVSRAPPRPPFDMNGPANRLWGRQRSSNIGVTGRTFSRRIRCPLRRSVGRLGLAALQTHHDRSAVGVREPHQPIGKVTRLNPSRLALKPLILVQRRKCGTDRVGRGRHSSFDLRWRHYSMLLQNLASSS